MMTTNDHPGWPVTIIDGRMVSCLPRWEQSGGKFATCDFYGGACTFCGKEYRTSDQPGAPQRVGTFIADDEYIALHGDRSDEPLSRLYPPGFFGEGRP